MDNKTNEPTRRCPLMSIEYLRAYVILCRYMSVPTRRIAHTTTTTTTSHNSNGNNNMYVYYLGTTIAVCIYNL